MKKILLLMFAVCIFNTFGATTKPQKYTGDLYEIQIYSNYLKNSGVQFIKLNNVLLFNVNKMYMWCVGEDGKVQRMSDKFSPKYDYENDVMVTNKEIIGDKDNKVYANVSRTSTFSKDTITTKNIVKVKESFKRQYSWSNFLDLFSLNTENLKGATVEGTLKNGEVVTVLIPKKYSKDKWNFRGAFVKLLIKKDDVAIEITTENGTVSLLHYGAKSMELRTSPDVAPSHEMTLKAGRVFEWTYQIKFIKENEGGK